MTIQVYCGLPGGGKSYALALAAYAARKSKLVFSNTPIRGTLKLDPDWLKTGQFPANSLLLIDEAGVVFNSREWAKLPQETYLSLAQHRKGGIDLDFAVQAPHRVDVVIRELAALWIECSATRFPFTDRVLWFNQKAYIDPEQCFSGQEPWKSRRILPSRRIYQSFDTYYMLDKRVRELVEQLPWDKEMGPLPDRRSLRSMAVALSSKIRRPAPKGPEAPEVPVSEGGEAQEPSSLGGARS